MHGGSVTANSRGPGEGSEFVVTLLLLQNWAPEAAFGADDRIALSYRLIDDNVDARDAVKMLL